MSARQYVAEASGSLGDREIAERLSKAGFSTNAISVQKRRIDQNIRKVATGAGSYRVTPSPFARYDSPPTYEVTAW